MKQLTDKQLRFVELYAGNASEAAKLAGYSHPRMAGKRCLKDEYICTLIADKRKAEIKPHIKDRQARQKFWSDFMDNEEKDDKDRLKASELLARSEGDFLDRVENSGEISLNIKWAD
jgi:phage terminase small subunit